MITPLRNMILVELRDIAPPPSGIISVVRLERQPSTHARVLAIGEEVRDVEVGANVVVSRLQGIEIGDGTLMLPESAVLALVQPSRGARDMTISETLCENCGHTKRKHSGGGQRPGDTWCCARASGERAAPWTALCNCLAFVAPPLSSEESPTTPTPCAAIHCEFGVQCSHGKGHQLPHFSDLPDGRSVRWWDNHSRKPTLDAPSGSSSVPEKRPGSGLTNTDQSDETIDNKPAAPQPEGETVMQTWRRIDTELATASLGKVPPMRHIQRSSVDTAQAMVTRPDVLALIDEAISNSEAE